MRLEEKRRDHLDKMYQIIGAAMEVYNELGYGYIYDYVKGSYEYVKSMKEDFV